MGQSGRATGPQEGGANYPHHVDLIPPPEGFADSVEEEIIQFLESRSGRSICSEISQTAMRSFDTALNSRRTRKRSTRSSHRQPKKRSSKRKPEFVGISHVHVTRPEAAFPGARRPSL